jgi:hypothetical protein
MKNAGLLFTALLLSTGAACVAEDDAPPDIELELDVRDGGKGDGQSCDVDPRNPTAYIANFLYRDVSAPSDRYRRYRVGFTFDQHVRLSNGDLANVTMYLLPQGRAILNYSENLREDATRSVVRNETVVVTRYSADPTTRAITLAGVGTMTPETVSRTTGCVLSLKLVFTSDLRTRGLAGGKTVMSSGTSTRYVIDPDHLDQVPSATARRWFQEDVASGKIVVIRK